MVPAQFGRYLMLCSLALLVACASAPKVRVDKDTHVDFSQYKTFGWLERNAPDAANPQKQPSTLLTQRVRAAVSAALQSKGYKLLEADPDFRVDYLLNIYDRPKQSGMSVGLGAGGGSGHVGGGVGVRLPIGKRTETVAQLTIDMIDAKRNAQVWTGSFESVIKEPSVSDTEIDQLVATILAKFP